MPKKLKRRYDDLIRYTEKQRILKTIESEARDGGFYSDIVSEIRVESQIDISFTSKKINGFDYNLTGWNLREAKEAPNIFYCEGKAGHIFVGNQWVNIEIDESLRKERKWPK